MAKFHFMYMILQTGRLFVRNLPYSCTEEDLEEKFKKFGKMTLF